MFVQIIEGQTRDAEGVRRQGERWLSELRPGAAGFVGLTSGVSADGRTITIACFESEAAARANSDRPEQGAWWAETAKYYDGEAGFTETSDVQEMLGGPSSKAAFVQIMRSRGVDRDAVARLDELFAEYSPSRPEIIGLLRCWTGPDTCVEAAYFTTEAAARAGEQREMPAELQAAMAESPDSMGTTEFLDLIDALVFRS
ncbi:MAG: hypothetical protein HYZ59_01255 [Actinobacteria bacterium]|nr:hypothetical protein [Actinomycetota bacterium]